MYDHLRYVGLDHTEVPIEESPQEPGRHGPGKVLAESEEKLSDKGEEEPQEQDGLATKDVRRPAPAETPDKVAEEEGTTEEARLLACSGGDIDS